MVISIIQISSDYLSEDFINVKVMEVLQTLAEDKVPNIRFRVSNSLAALSSKFKNANKLKAVDILEKQKSDEDFDVQHFASKAMESFS